MKGSALADHEEEREGKIGRVRTGAHLGGCGARAQ